MKISSGRYYPVSLFRRLVIDLLHFSSQVPTVTIERNMKLEPLVKAKESCPSEPTWSAIFLKAFAVVSARTPALRSSYLQFPWGRFYEHYSSIATLNVDRQTNEEHIVIYAQIHKPELLPIQQIDAIISDHQKKPIETLPSYKTARHLSRVPWPFRRLIWWAALNTIGSVRCRFFGTFGITSVGSQGAGITFLFPLLTTQLHYGMIDQSGNLEMRLSFDHRVLDGVSAARALADLELVLVGEMVRECAQMAQPDCQMDPQLKVPERNGVLVTNNEIV